jgi:glycosyltransferase involved in cell wall biosynthesis
MFHSPNQSFISVSNNQRTPIPDINYAATIYNCVNSRDFPYSAQHDDYLLFVGRLTPEKGVKEAVQVAYRTGQRLLIIGPLYNDHQTYFDEHVRPFLSDKIRYLGHIKHDKELAEYFQKARCLLTPIQWEEPFGVTMIEAMACGTPVIAFKRGSVPEIIVDHKTGFVVTGIDEMIGALQHLDDIKRRDCHEHAVKHFSTAKMIDAYETAFERIIEASKVAKD